MSKVDTAPNGAYLIQINQVSSFFPVFHNVSFNAGIKFALHICQPNVSREKKMIFPCYSILTEDFIGCCIFLLHLIYTTYVYGFSEVWAGLKAAIEA